MKNPPMMVVSRHHGDSHINYGPTILKQRALPHSPRQLTNRFLSFCHEGRPSDPRPHFIQFQFRFLIFHPAFSFLHSGPPWVSIRLWKALLLACKLAFYYGFHPVAIALSIHRAAYHWL